MDETRKNEFEVEIKTLIDMFGRASMVLIEKAYLTGKIDAAAECEKKINEILSKPLL